MDVQDIIDEIDVAGFDDLEEADKVGFINRTVKGIVNREPWAFREVFDDLDASTDIDADGLVDYSKLTYEFGGLMDIVNTGSGGYNIRWIRRDVHFKDRALQLDLTGTPYNHFFVGRQMYLYPIPTSGTFRITYLAHQGDLDASSGETDILLPAQWHEAIIAGALYRINAREDDPENAAMFKSMFDEIMENMRQDLEKVQWDSPDSILFYDWDDGEY
jgi:hypothetical protein